MILWWALLARADPAGDEIGEPEAILVTGTHDPADPSLTPSQVTVVPIDAQIPASADVATAVARAPGAVIQRLGGLGDLAVVGLRGSASRQVEVTIDGVPLNPEGGSAVDLSELPLRGFERVMIYRGFAPPLAGSGAMGGVVALQTGERRAAGLTLSGGSWGTARGTALASAPLPALPGGSAWFAADGLATAGTFPWYDDGGTRIHDDDDRVVARSNNDARQLSTVSRLRAGEQLQLTAMHAGLWRTEGVPGATFAPTEGVRSDVSRHLVALRGEGTSGAVRGAVLLCGLQRLETFDDRGAEIGLTADWIASRTETARLRGSLSALTARQLRLDAGLGISLDRFQADDLIRQVPGTPSGRRVARGVLAATLGPQPLRLTPGLTAIHLASSAPGADAARTLALPRVGARLDGRGPWQLKANAGASARPPDLLELFGDRGPLVGNPGLRPERGIAVDLGIGGAPGATQLEAVGFARRVQDLIVWRQGPQGVSRAENVDEATLAGLEGALAWSRGGLSLGANGALVRAVDTSDDPTYRGNQLPRVPVASAELRGALSRGPIRLALDLSWAAGSFADAANFVPQPSRALLGGTLTAGPWDGWALELDVRNALDRIVATVPRDPLVDDGTTTPAAVVDLGGYPLPGRTFLLTVRLSP